MKYIKKMLLIFDLSKNLFNSSSPMYTIGIKIVYCFQMDFGRTKFMI